MAKHVHAPQSFLKKHRKEVEEFKELFIDYVAAVYPQNQTIDGGRSGAGNNGRETVTSTPVYADRTQPSLADIELSTLSKKELVNVMRRYFTAHYCESRKKSSAPKLMY